MISNKTATKIIISYELLSNHRPPALSISSTTPRFSRATSSIPEGLLPSQSIPHRLPPPHPRHLPLPHGLPHSVYPRLFIL